MNTLNTISSTLATVSSVTYKLSTRAHPQHDGELVVLDSSGSEVPEDGSDDAAVRGAMERLGYELVDSGANGAPEGGYYSYWREVPAYSGATIWLAEDRESIDPNGEMDDAEVEAVFSFIRDAVRKAFPGARVRVVDGLTTTATMRDGCTSFDRDVDDVVQQAWGDWCSQADEG